MALLNIEKDHDSTAFFIYNSMNITNTYAMKKFGDESEKNESIIHRIWKNLMNRRTERDEKKYEKNDPKKNEHLFSWKTELITIITMTECEWNGIW